MGALVHMWPEDLSRVGIAKLIIVDRDYIEFSNLQKTNIVY